LAAELHKRQMPSPPPGLFDNVEKYWSRLNLEEGRIRDYIEEMQVEWVIVDPAAMKDTTTQLRAMKMGARRLHRLERLK
jgi:hypothetical protein